MIVFMLEPLINDHACSPLKLASSTMIITELILEASIMQMKKVTDFQLIIDNESFLSPNRSMGKFSIDD